METSDPLTELIVDSRELDRQRVVNVLRNRMALDRETSDPVILSGFESLNATQKILALMLLRRVAILLDRGEGQGLSPKLAASQTGLPEGTARRVLRELIDAHQTSQKPDGSYFLSNPQITSAIESLAEKEAAEDSHSQSGDTTKSQPQRHVTESRSKGNTPVRSRTSSQSRQTSRGPTELVRGLLDGGFFDKEPKTLSQVQRRLKDKTGYEVPATTLSKVLLRMLRSGELDREYTADDVYEYKRARSND